MIIDGIKLKQMIRTKVRRNTIDVYPFYPGYDGQSTTYSKSGIYFAASDTANVDCVVEDNDVYQSAKTPAGLSSNRALFANPDQTVNTNVVSSGNRIINNRFTDMYTGVWFKPDTHDYYAEGNAMTRVTVPYDNDGYNNTIKV
jgi:hypothetical protein